MYPAGNQSCNAPSPTMGAGQSRATILSLTHEALNKLDGLIKASNVLREAVSGAMLQEPMSAPCPPLHSGDMLSLLLELHYKLDELNSLSSHLCNTIL